MSTEACWGCGAPVPVIVDGATHRYIGASAGCWSIYERLQVRLYEEGSATGQMLVDTYAAQHPGVPGPQSSQSVAVHLMSLCAQLERDLAPERATDRLQVYLRPRQGKRPVFAWLPPPASLGPVTVLDVVDAALAPAIPAWARSVWDAWKPHHAQVRAWLDQYA